MDQDINQQARILTNSRVAELETERSRHGKPGLTETERDVLFHRLYETIRETLVLGGTPDRIMAD